MAELLELKDHYANCFDSLPEALRDTPYGERLLAIAEADIEALEALDPPLGYGRDA